MRVSSPSTAKTILTGFATPTGSATTVFTVPHGLGAIPSYSGVTPQNVLSSALFFVTADATNVKITYLTGLTGQLALNWIVIA